jgi:glc operon protein GlcG
MPEPTGKSLTWEELMRRLTMMTVAACAALMFGTAVHAQAPIPAAAPPPAPPPYGEPITLEQAKKVAAAAEAEAKKLNLNDAVAIVEPNGTLVYLQKMDGTQYGGNNVAIDKATSSALFRRPTTAFEAALKAGNTYLLQLRGANAVPGGVPIVFNGKLIGGIGISGGSGAQDVQVAEAGLAGLK